MYVYGHYSSSRVSSGPMTLSGNPPKPDEN